MRDKMRDKMRNKVRDKMRDKVRDKMRNKLRDKVKDKQAHADRVLKYQRMRMTQWTTLHLCTRMLIDRRDLELQIPTLVPVLTLVPVPVPT